jgi:phosphatidylserine/phosphatidylglycerophosphate/cardiolipin synthase-like enzyme
VNGTAPGGPGGPGAPRERDIYAAGTKTVPYELLQSLFAAELLRPSRRFWIVSAWLSNVEVLDNTARQFAALDPEWPAARIRLSRALASMLRRGTEVVVVTNANRHNDDFMARMREHEERFGKRLHLIRTEHLHEKGILGDHFTLDGSMNLTYSGIFVNEEHLIYRYDPTKVAERRVQLENRWRDALCS